MTTPREFRELFQQVLYIGQVFFIAAGIDANHPLARPDQSQLHQLWQGRNGCSPLRTHMQTGATDGRGHRAGNFGFTDCDCRALAVTQDLQNTEMPDAPRDIETGCQSLTGGLAIGPGNRIFRN